MNSGSVIKSMNSVRLRRWELFIWKK